MTGGHAEHPFIDNGEGFPTPSSAQAALEMFNLGSIADIRVNFRDKDGSVVDLITRCRIERLVENWPDGFIAQVIGAATEGGQHNGGS